MNVLRLAAFSDNGRGGNPAGVAFYEEMPPASEMLQIAADVGYSETAFAVPHADGWRVRYFAPAMEVPFCGHATIALGAALGEKYGPGEYKLYLNDGQIRVQARETGDGLIATLYSPGTHSQDAPREYLDRVLEAFSLREADLEPDFPIRLASAGARHLIIVLRDRKMLADMSYPFERVRELMNEQGLVTISLLWRESDGCFHSRNAFASGGVYEDPATGAAAAALAGYLRDVGWKGNGSFTIIQGQDMGMPSRLMVKYGATSGASVEVSGEVRQIQDSG